MHMNADQCPVEDSIRGTRRAQGGCDARTSYIRALGVVQYRSTITHVLTSQFTNGVVLGM